MDLSGWRQVNQARSGITQAITELGQANLIGLGVQTLLEVLQADAVPQRGSDQSSFCLTLRAFDSLVQDAVASLTIQGLTIGASHQ